MAERWVEVQTTNYKHAVAILDFLIDVARYPRHFKTEDMCSYNKEVLTEKNSPRVLRNLRLKGLISYEVINQKWGIYQLHSNLEELLESRQRVVDGGYYIDEESPMVISNSFAFPVEQMSLL